MAIDTQSLTEDELERFYELSGKYMEHYSKDESDGLAYEQLFGIQDDKD